jgi:hypothetical protein
MSLFEPPDGFEGPPQLMAEVNDLDADTRKRIIWLQSKLWKWNYYDLLQLNPLARPSTEQIKKAFFERSKEWHPDRFAKRELGSFKPMVQDIWEELERAHFVLSRPRRRYTYDKEHGLNALDIAKASVSPEVLRIVRRIKRGHWGV